MRKSLVCSENSYFQAYINHSLRPDGVQVVSISTFDELKQKISSEEFSSVIIDTCYPNDLALQFIKSIHCPVIILDSLKTEVTECNPAPLLNLLNNVSSQKHKHNVFKFTPSTFFDIGKHCIWKKDEYIPLAIQEFKILYLLHLNSNKTVSSEELIEYADLTGRSSLYVHINSLREKIEENPGDPKIIQTKFGKGYLILNQTSSCLEKKEGFQKARLIKDGPKSHAK
ncbi:winged helix-turn-helix domain-containing protein [Bacillus atrophaeus]|uniref:winged helix-turn-helix domain-containing protein n=1 Tax=Bacillus atrophaeus TaxID=1452 RepID=UPI0012384C99|nr:winged helix-turn-helix domain-containing protein [Bacillus atrophaeus]KAA6450010.1 DNA-binding response regulator [Bacillus atrophaeus]